MDPELWELFESGSPEDEVSVIIRMEKGIEPPPTIRVVSRFGDIFTARLRRDEIVAVRQRPGVASIKASGVVTMPGKYEAFVSPEDEGDVEGAGEATARLDDVSRITETGKGVVVGVCDWGLDFTHPNFRNADGTTRLECIWDQRGFDSALAPQPYNQGRLLTRAAINAALADPDPFAALDYHPADADPTGTGAHATHVMDILAGNRREPGSEVGLATESDLVFVHLAPTRVGELGNLGDSIGLLEGLDFIRRQAAGRPCVLHLSAGKTLGPKRGTTLLERAVDTMLQEPGVALVQSVGNYAKSGMHTHARIGPDQRHELLWITPDNDRTPNELEVWYSGEDVFEVTLISPGGRQFTTPLDTRLRLTDGTSVWGNFYHRLREPNSGLNHVVIILYRPAPSGRWRVVLRGRDIVDGRVHAWIERDVTGRYQSRFGPAQATSRFTTNTICNCFRSIAVGAYDATKANRPPTLFSSRGPTADGRQKPELAAPGYRILAARSTPKQGFRSGERRLCAKSGTSMAAPWVSGTVALMFAAARRPLSIHDVRRILIGTADPHGGPAGRTSTQLGYGYLNVAAAVDAARQLGHTTPTVPIVSSPSSRPTATREGEPEWMPVPEDALWVAEDEIASPPTWVEDAALYSLEASDARAVIAFNTSDGLESFSALDVAPEADPDIADEARPPCNCGCAHCQEAKTSAGIAGESLEDADEEEAIEEPAPFVWEDIREALEAYDRVD